MTADLHRLLGAALDIIEQDAAQDARPLRLVRGPVPSVALTRTQPVTLALGDWAQLLTLADDTPEAHRIESAAVTLPLSVPQIAAVCSLLELVGTDWAHWTQEAVAVQVHPSLLPAVDDCPPRGIPRPDLLAVPQSGGVA